MIGCRYGAKNTLVKNYLWFAERLGVEVMPERQVTDGSARSAPADGSDGYAVTTEHPGAWLRKRRRTLTAPRRRRRRRRRWAPTSCSRECKHGGALPRISDRLGARRAHQQRVDPGGHRARRRARLLEVGRDHVEHLPRPRHPHRGRRPTARNGDAISRLFTMMTGDGTRRDAAAEVARRRCCATRSGPLRTAVAVRVVAADGHPAGDADARHRDAAGAEAAAASGAASGCRPSRTPSARTRPSSRPPSRRRAGSPSGSAASRRAASPSRRSTSRPPRTSSAAR